MVEVSRKITAAARQLPAAKVRTQAAIPAVLYGHGLPSRALQVDGKQFSQVFAHTGTTSLLTLSVEGKDHPVLIREVQYHPLKEAVQHIDFYQVRLDEVIKAKVPLHLVGESSAVKDLGGVLVRNVDALEIEALPQDLPHAIKVNISSLDTFEKPIRVKDLAIPAGVKVLVDLETVAILVQAPRSEAELEALKEEVKEDVAAVEGVVKPEVTAEGEAAPAEGADKKPDKKPEEGKK